MTAAPGQIMPVAATLVAGTRGTTERQESYPSLADVVAALEQHGVSVRSEHVDAREMSEEAVQQWLHKQQQSGVAVVILHRSDTSSARNLGSSSSSTATPPTLFEISQYQITLWTAIGLVAITLSAVIALGGMHVEPDSILYAKFISGRTKND